MPIKKKLTKHGNSFALVIDRSILDLLGITPSTTLSIFSPDGNSLIISPEKTKKEKNYLEEELEEINKEYGKTLKRLADK